MHEIVFYAAAVWMTVLLAVGVGIVLRGQSALIRILALDALSLVLIGLLILYSASRHVPYYLDAALILALLSFVSSVAAARYTSEGRLF